MFRICVFSLFTPAAIIASKNHHTKIYTDPLQQIDLYQGIKNYVSDQSCTDRWRGDALQIPPIAAEWIIHRRGDQRDKISVFLYTLLL